MPFLLADLGEQQAEADAALGDGAIVVPLLLHLGPRGVRIVLVRSPHARAAARSGGTPASTIDSGTGKSCGSGELIEQLPLHMGAGEAVQLLLDLALHQLAQLVESLQTHGLGEIVVGLDRARRLDLVDGDIEGRGAALQIIDRIIVREGDVDAPAPRSPCAPISWSSKPGISRPEPSSSDMPSPLPPSNGSPSTLPSKSMHDQVALSAACWPARDRSSSGPRRCGRPGRRSIASVGSTLQALDLQALDLRFRHVGQGLDLDIKHRVLAGAAFLERDAAAAWPAGSSARLEQLLTPPGPRSPAPAARARAVHLADEVGGDLAGAEAGHPHLRRDRLQLLVDAGVDIFGGNGDPRGALQALVQRLDGLHGFGFKPLVSGNRRHRSVVAKLVRAKGLEPPHLSIPGPKPGASTSSATPAEAGGRRRLGGDGKRARPRRSKCQKHPSSPLHKHPPDPRKTAIREPSLLSWSLMGCVLAGRRDRRRWRPPADLPANHVQRLERDFPNAVPHQDRSTGEIRPTTPSVSDPTPGPQLVLAIVDMVAVPRQDHAVRRFHGRTYVTNSHPLPPRSPKPNRPTKRLFPVVEQKLTVRSANVQLARLSTTELSAILPGGPLLQGSFFMRFKALLVGLRGFRSPGDREAPAPGNLPNPSGRTSPTSPTTGLKAATRARRARPRRPSQTQFPSLGLSRAPPAAATGRSASGRHRTQPATLQRRGRAMAGQRLASGPSSDPEPIAVEAYAGLRRIRPRCCRRGAMTICAGSTCAGRLWSMLDRHCQPGTRSDVTAHNTARGAPWRPPAAPSEFSCFAAEARCDRPSWSRLMSLSNRPGTTWVDGEGHPVADNSGYGSTRP